MSRVLRHNRLLHGRLRLHRAQALCDERKLNRLMDSTPQLTVLTPEQTRERAFALVNLLFDHEQLLKRAQRLHGRLRLLLKKRTGGKPDFKILTRDHRFDREGLLSSLS